MSFPGVRHGYDINVALGSLVEALLPQLPDEDDDDYDERVANATERSRDTLRANPSPGTVEDIQHVGDLIKKKLIDDSDSPAKAVRFSSLYSKLLSHNVLEKKWDILKFLLAIYEGPEEEPDASRQSFADAFSSQGLHRLPMRDNRDVPGSRDADERPGTDAGMKTKAEILSEARGSNDDELKILGALPYTLMGLESTSLPFKSITNNPLAHPTAKYAITIPPDLPLPLVSLLYTLAEPSLLYRALNEYVNTASDGVAGGGLVGQSLRSAIGTELQGYVNLIGGLEAEIRRTLASAKESKTTKVTLKRCVLWTREATMGLRLMNLIVEKTRDQKGGQLISSVHSFASSHGDPFVHDFAERLLADVTRPFYDMLRHWIYEGELTDPFTEFFVTRAEGGDVDKGAASSVWRDKYAFHAPQVPSIITEGFAKKVFLIGKSLNFIRHGCSDSEWVEEYSKSTSKELRYGDTAKLEMNIDEAYKTTMARLISLMNNKFKLSDHLIALKKFLLLGQGDFIALLMESLAGSLERPANTLYRHNLTAQLEHAIRGSNAQFENPDVLRRLDARMLELSHGEVGWDVFTLEYKIDPPVDVVITALGSKQYLKVFNFLWRIKRVEFALGSCWRRFMTGARGVLRSVDDIVGADWKKARCVVAEMVHFVNQLQYYILFEVIESGWNGLMKAMSKPDITLDDVIEAHTQYLEHITHKGLLGSATTKPGRKRTGTETGDETFMMQLHELLKIMLNYKAAVEGLYGYSVAENTRKLERSAKIDQRTKQGEWGIREDDDPTLPSGGYTDQTLPNLRARLQNLSNDFQSRVVQLLGDLAYQPDMDLRLLGVLLSFNEFYVIANKRRANPHRERAATEKAAPATAAPVERVAGQERAERRNSTGRERERRAAK